MKFTKLVSVVVLILSQVYLGGCKKKDPEELPILFSEIVYEINAIMDRGKDDVHRYQFYGKRSYRDKSNNVLTHYFVMDDPSDKLTLTLNFVNPLIPGDQKSMFFSQIDNNVSVQTWELLVKNTTSSLVSAFEFRFSLNPNPNPQTVVAPDGSVKIIREYQWANSGGAQGAVRGLYELSEISQYLGVSMRWAIKNPVSANAIFDAQ